MISSTFCVLPWVHLATYTDGSALLCCVAQNNLNLNLNSVTLGDVWNSEQLKSVRLKMLRGEKVSSCSHCYKEEAAGHQSHRLVEENVWISKYSKSWIESKVAKTASNGHLDESILSLDLRISNKCNLTCVMCRPQDSSRWTAVAKKIENTLRDETLFYEWLEKNKVEKNNFDWSRRAEFWENFETLLPEITELVIGGGEPMLLEEHQKLINLCITSGHASHIQLRYHTNGTVLDSSIFESWKDFKFVEVFVSLDGIEEKNTYMRYPADWLTLQKNLMTLDSYPHGNARVLLLCSIHMMSIFYLADFADWIEKQNFKLIAQSGDGYFHAGIVHYPDYLSAQVLPENVKAHISEKIRAFEVRSKRPSANMLSVLSYMNQSDRSDLLDRTKEYIRSLDLARNTSFKKSLPELSSFLDI